MDWTALLAAEDENPRSRLVTELLASDAYGSMESRAAAFVRQGGGCRATFFNYRRKIVYSLGSDRFVLFVYSLGSTLWGQTDLEFSPLRPRARSSARRSRLAFDSLWSRAANRADRLGTLSGRERPRIGTSSARVASVWCFAR